MPYTNNVPQGNQQIASTQPLIQQNFGFIQTDARIEHIFNGNMGPLGAAQAEGTHIQASMPNQNLKGATALPTGTNGVFYVSSGQAIYNNGTTDFNMIQNLQRNGSIGAGITQILAVGSYIGIVSAQLANANPPSRYAFFQFWLNAGVLSRVDSASGGGSDIDLTTAGGNLQLVNNTGGTVKYQIFYQVGAP
jgi:hypothetical protein